MEIHQVVVLTTALTREQKIKLQKCCSLLHWKMVDDFIPEGRLASGKTAEHIY